jgi:predicted MFS family arabinose efflux permease
VTGDQLARVAITLLVFSETRSALLAAIAFAASVVPTFVGGLTLSGLADRWPRRQVMIAADLCRAVMVAVMALPWMPIAVRIILLFLVTTVSAPFTAARAALYPDILPGDRYVLGTAVTLTTLQFAQVLGFAAGGAVVAFFGVRASLLVDAATFILSAVIIRIWVRYRPAAHPRPVGASPAGLTPAGPPGSGLRAGLRLIFASPALLAPMLYGWLSTFYNVPEGIAAPLAGALGGGDVAVGLILAAGAFGASVGAVLFGRLVEPQWRLRWMAPLATMSCAVLMLFFFQPPLPVALLVLMTSGIFDCYQLAANAAFVRAVPYRQRSQAFGIAQGGMNLGQGTAMIIAGAVAQHVAPSDVIAATGLLGTVAAISVALLSRNRATESDPSRPAG